VGRRERPTVLRAEQCDWFHPAASRVQRRAAAQHHMSYVTAEEMSCRCAGERRAASNCWCVRVACAFAALGTAASADAAAASQQHCTTGAQAVDQQPHGAGGFSAAFARVAF
jgi:hypothetical protein